jgi:acyl-coenzyme A thioesterase PaaI-like protein
LNGLGIKFRATADGSIEGTFDCDPFYQGYDGILHGGVISAILDGAMTHCLFAHGRNGVTARLIVRFLEPVAVDRPAVIRARLCDYSPPLYILEAELSQDGKVLTRATAKFIVRE